MLGALQKKFKKSEITMEVGLTRNFFGKSSQNSAKPVFWSSIPCVFCLYIVQSVGYYDLSVLSMSVIGFQQKKFGWGWVGGVSSTQAFFWDFLNFFNFA